MKYRIMIKGEDGMIWCEKNNVTEEYVEAYGEDLCEQYEGATWWIEEEDEVPHYDYYWFLTVR